MKNKITKLIAALVVFAFAGSLVLAPATYAADDDPFCRPGMGEEAKKAMGCTDKDEKDLTDTVLEIIRVIVGMLGIVAVVFIIIGGVGYMTSSGDSGKVKKAKDTILYAVIGLIICALAFAIVNFAISTINK